MNILRCALDGMVVSMVDEHSTVYIHGLPAVVTYKRQNYMFTLSECNFSFVVRILTKPDHQTLDTASIDVSKHETT